MDSLLVLKVVFYLNKLISGNDLEIRGSQTLLNQCGPLLGSKIRIYS